MSTRHYRPETYRAKESVGYLVRRLYSSWLEHFEQVLAGAGLTLTQWIVLIQLRDRSARTASDLSQDLGHDSGAITRVLDQLEGRGLVARRRSAADRRVVELDLTRAGAATVAELLPVVVDHTNAALAPLDRAEFALLRDMLGRLLEHAQRNPPAPVARATARRKAASRRKST